MSYDWCRLWHDMPTDPKWRLIATKAEVSIPDVIAVFTFMLVRASQNVPRGTIDGWSDEVVGVALNLPANAIERIRTQSTGLLLDGTKLIGWERRQPKREDGSAERSSAWRQRQKEAPNATDRNRTQTNTDKTRLDKTREGEEGRNKRARPLPDDWSVSEELIAYAKTHGFDHVEALSIGDDLRVWAAANGTTKVSWDATYQGFIRRAKKGTTTNGANGHGRSGSFAALSRELRASIADDEAEAAGSDFGPFLTIGAEEGGGRH